METITFDHDITVFYITASSFPDGILQAHQSLHKLVPYSPDRKYFGISRPENGTIVYRASTEEIYEGEAVKLNCRTLVLKKGIYTTVTIHDYLNDVDSIQRTFQELLQTPGIDPQGYCVEWYINQTDVICMIRLKE